ncbi:MAG TPA: DUF3592 domain-containing protein [Bryobacteraceae bacterium]|nr:DUF3592 domain-containing protein [Bryobacteraceae bacterium]
MTATVYGTLGLCLALGIFLVFVGVQNIWRALASRKWPTAPATVVSSERKVSRSSDGSSTVEAEVVARYSVKGREYTTSTQKFGQIFGSSDTSVAELQRLRYPPGGAISVSYHPAQPGLATIEPGFDAEALWGPGAGVAFILVAVMFGSLYRNSESSGGGMAFGVSVFAAIFMMTGGAMLLAGGSNLYRAYASQSWPSTTGEIVYDDVDATTSTTRDQGRTRTSTTYGARIIFKYEAGGKVRYSNTRRFGELAGSDEEWANAIADKYPYGVKLPVYYHPADPNLAILEPGITSEAYWIPGAGLAFFLFGLAAALIIVPEMRKF